MSDQKNVSLIFGATGSVGKEVVKMLGEQQIVVPIARDQTALQQLCDETGTEGYLIDLEQPATIKDAISQAAEKHGRIDGVANCIGNMLLKAGHQTSEEEWQETMQVNLTSCFLILQAIVPEMRKNGGSVVFVASAAAEQGMANHEAIAAAKAGVIGLTRSAAATYATRKIRFNCVSPGLFKSNMTRHLWEDEKTKSLSESMNPLGQLGEPGDIARMIVWLLDPANNWITGQVFSIDGGLSSLMQRPKAKL